MAQNQNQFSDHQNDDLRSGNLLNNDPESYDDGIGENTEQTPIAKASEVDERIPTITADNENGLPGPDDDEDTGTDDDDEDYDELIPTEGDDDESEDLGDDDIVGEHDDPNIDVSKVGGNASSRPHGRTSGRMVDHEPGVTGPQENSPYGTR